MILDNIFNFQTILPIDRWFRYLNIMIKLYLLTFCKLPSYNTMDNVLPNRYIKNIASQDHEALVFIKEICYRNNQLLMKSYVMIQPTN